MEENITGKNILFLKNFEKYLYPSLFFLILSFFIFFIIRPNLRQVVLARQKLSELKKIDTQYSRLLEKIIEFQSNLEEHRGDLIVIDEALPNFPQINKVIADIQKVIRKNNLFINSMSVSNVNLTHNAGHEELNSLKIDLILSGGFEEFYSFLSDLKHQRKIKVVDNFLITNESSSPQSTEAANLKFQLQVKSFHL